MLLEGVSAVAEMGSICFDVSIKNYTFLFETHSLFEFRNTNLYEMPDKFNLVRNGIQLNVVPFPFSRVFFFSIHAADFEIKVPVYGMRLSVSNSELMSENNGPQMQQLV